MRVSTSSRYTAAVQSLQQRQNDLSASQTQMTTGKRINRPSDDPAGAARAERAYIALQRIASDQRSVEASRNAMTIAESALGQAGDTLQSVRETLVAAGNGSLDAAGRATQASQLSQLRSQLLALANQAGSAGGYLFGGQSGSTLPFFDMPEGVQATAVGGQRQASTGEQLPITVDGRAIWLGAASGNGVFVSAASASNQGSGWIDAGTVTDPALITGSNSQISFVGTGAATTYSVSQNGAVTSANGLVYSAGSAITVDGMSFHISGAPAAGDSFTLGPSTPDLNVFAALDRVMATLKTSTANAGQVTQSITSGLRDIDSIMGHLQTARSEAGSMLTRLDAIAGRNQDRTLWAKSMQSDAEDVDMVQAISEFKNQQTGYQAALQSYASVQRLSLFDYLK